MSLVSVIIPVYNAEKYIVETLESVFCQTYGNYEVIVVNDGSTDNSMEVIKPFSGRSNFRIVHQINSGPSRARNEGIKAARGTYCAFLDADDIMLPDRLALQVKVLDERPDAGLTYSDLITFNENGVIHSTKKEFIRPHSGDVLRQLLKENFITTSTVLLRRECFDKVSFFDENIRHSEDYKMWLNIAKIYKVQYLDLPLVKYRYHSESLSSNRIVISTSSCDVVKEFWEENRAYKIKNERLYRISMANQLMNVGEAYRKYGRNRKSAEYLIKSLIMYPFMKGTYRVMIKNVLGLFKNT